MFQLLLLSSFTSVLLYKNNLYIPAPYQFSKCSVHEKSSDMSDISDGQAQMSDERFHNFE